MAAPRAREVRTTVVVVGGGMSGICAAVKLRKQRTPFVVLEKSPSPGGTWHDNRYPSCACDIPYLQYTFSFNQHIVKDMYAPAATIKDYMLATCDKFKVRDDIVCNCTVLSCTFDEAASEWVTRARMSGGDGDGRPADVVYRSRFLVSATGQLNTPKVPAFRGVDQVRVPAFHTARWDSSVNLDGKRVAVIGNGASGVQCVEGLYKRVARLYVFQRTPKWMLRRPLERLPGWLTWMLLHLPFMLHIVRLLGFLYQEYLHMTIAGTSRLARFLTRKWVGQLSRGLARVSRAASADLVPRYALGCNRFIIQSQYTRALRADNVEVVEIGGPNRSLRLAAKAVCVDTTAAGTDEAKTQQAGSASGAGAAAGGEGSGGVVTREVEVDAIVYATGFAMNNCIPPFPIVGSKGATLADAWRVSPEAYMGVATTGFPNMFMLYGPNTNTIVGSITFFSECAVNYIAQAIKHCCERRLRHIEVKPQVLARYQAHLAELASTRPESGACNSWYKNKATGRVVQNFPGTMSYYWWLTRSFKAADYVTC